MEIILHIPTYFAAVKASTRENALLFGGLKCLKFSSPFQSGDVNSCEKCCSIIQFKETMLEATFCSMFKAPMAAFQCSEKPSR